MSASHAVGRGFVSRLGHIYHHKKLTAWQSNLTVKGLVVCGTLWGHAQKRSPGINCETRE